MRSSQLSLGGPGWDQFASYAANSLNLTLQNCEGLRATRLFLDRMPEFYRKFEASSMSTTLTHSDYRADNIMLVAGDGPTEAFVVDWQLLTVAPAETDAAYFLCQSLTTRERLASEKECLWQYYTELLQAHDAAAAAPTTHSYPFLRCMRNFQLALLWCSRIPIVMLAEFTATNARAEELLKSMILRTIACLEDWGCLQALQLLLDRDDSSEPNLEECLKSLPPRKQVYSQR